MKRRMNASLIKRLIWICIAADLFILCIWLFSGLSFGIWSIRDWELCREMSRDCHPVWKELYDGRIRQGQSVDDVIALTHPDRVVRFHNYVVVDYLKDGYIKGTIPFSGLVLVAQDGRLVSAYAGSCNFLHTFFEELSEADRQLFWQWRGAYGNAVNKSRQSAQLGQLGLALALNQHPNLKSHLSLYLVAQEMFN
jgi:hypothetical protein